LWLVKGFAQETEEAKARLNASVIERFSVLKSDKNIKEGPYKALFNRKTILATGNYKNNFKEGVWHFYKPNGELIQKFNFNTNTLLYESISDTLFDVHYMVDEKLTPTDTLTRPVKIGGIYYGLLPYLNIFQLPFDTYGVNTDSFDAYVELLISPLGRLADYKVYVVSDLYQYKRTFNLDVNLFSQEDREFVPVTLNSKAILSRIFIKCSVTSDGGLEFD
jgi:hypothetical protein